MKKLFLFFMVYINIFIGSFSDENLSGKILSETYYENGNIESRKIKENDIVKTIYYFQNGNILKEESRKPDEKTKHGTFKVYHENGILLLEENYKDDVLTEGKNIICNIYGIPLKETVVSEKNGNRYMNVKEYFSAKSDKNLVLLSKKNFLNENAHGFFKYYDSRGEEVISHEYKNGELDGTTKIHDRITGIKREVKYKNGRKHGTEKIFLGNELLVNTVYRNGEIISREKRTEEIKNSGKGFDFLRENYFPDVPLEKKESFDIDIYLNNRLSIYMGTMSIEINEEGITYLVERLDKAKKTGRNIENKSTHFVYYDTGQFEKEFHTVQKIVNVGKNDSIHDLYNSGKVKDPVVISEICYYPNGQLQYENSAGQTLSYYENGQVYKEDILNKGKIYTTFYYPNGSIQRKAEKGVVYSYHDNGIIKKKSFERDNKTYEEYYDRTGKLVQDSVEEGFVMTVNSYSREGVSTETYDTDITGYKTYISKIKTILWIFAIIQLISFTCGVFYTVKKISQNTNHTPKERKSKIIFVICAAVTVYIIVLYIVRTRIIKI